MKLLNVGCGGNRPQDEHWINLDCLRQHLKAGTPERKNLDAEKNYVEHDLRAKQMPFRADFFDGILCSHVVEHFTAHAAVSILEDCRRILKPGGGPLVVSVPDADYFLKVYDRDTPQNAADLFGEPISADEPWQKSFFDYALFHREHQQVLTEPALMCLLLKAGFGKREIANFANFGWMGLGSEEHEIRRIVNRQKFSVILSAIKP